MSLITGTPITFNGQEARTGILEQAFDKPLMTALHRVESDIKAKTQIAFLGRLSKITRADAGCGTGKLTKTIPMSEKFWEPVPHKIWLSQCADDLESTFFVWGLNKGIDRKDLSNTENGYLEEFIMEVMTDATAEDALRIVWFGDVDASDVGGTGVLGDAADIPNYNTIDGFWKQIYTGVAATSIKKVAIPENALGSFAAQDALASNRAYLTFRAMMEQSDSRLKSNVDKMIICTDSLFDNWLAYKETQNMDMSFLRQDRGFMEDVYRGTRIVKFDLWDRYIRADYSDGTVYDLPHRAVMTVKDNLAVGFDDPDAVNKFKVYLNDETEETNMKGGYKLDAKLLQEYMITVAY